jgi:hypothetical protein
MTNPDLVFKASWPNVRFSGRALTTMMTALFKEANGYALEYE